MSRTITIPLVLLCLTTQATAQGLNGEQIVRKVEEVNTAKDEKSTVELVLITKDKRRQKRSMETLFLKGEGEDDKSKLKFLTPENVRGLSLLTHEASGRSDDQWVYLPAFKKVKKIASSKRTNRFAQTDFTYEDLRTEDFSAFTYKKVQDKKVGDRAVFVVEATPKTLGTTGYSKRYIAVDKERWATLEIVYYDKKDRKQKTLTNMKFTQFGKYWRPGLSKMQDHLRGSTTAMKFTARKLNKGMPTTLFTVKSLER
ncbi:MAG: outer membrane lipoprotein-sorting protein [Planctomycetes bacterium]|nr:outer membrane lipoprotein-sorting protein [Planctomycetota bacterium]